jgi:metalloendopeptidase OMA1, mitochondrial
VIYSGLIDLLEDDTLLSAVIAHEISHVVQRHAVENVRLYSDMIVMDC